MLNVRQNVRVCVFLLNVQLLMRGFKSAIGTGTCAKVFEHNFPSFCILGARSTDVLREHNSAHERGSCSGPVLKSVVGEKLIDGSNWPFHQSRAVKPSWPMHGKHAVSEWNHRVHLAAAVVCVALAGSENGLNDPHNGSGTNERLNLCEGRKRIDLRIHMKA